MAKTLNDQQLIDQIHRYAKAMNLLLEAAHGRGFKCELSIHETRPQVFFSAFREFDATPGITDNLFPGDDPQLKE